MGFVASTASAASETTQPTRSCDRDYSARLRLIKTFVTKHSSKQLNIQANISQSRRNCQEGNPWQRRFWNGFEIKKIWRARRDYSHFNPVSHGLCQTPQEWKFSSIHRFIAQGIYPNNWGCDLQELFLSKMVEGE